MSKTQFFTTSDGLRLAYRDEGNGIPVLCLAGLTRNMADFEPFMAANGDGYRYIRLDTRGRGDSAYDPSFMNYAVPVEARDALELLAHLGLSRVVIVGTSRGGLLAMAIAAVAPAVLAGVLLNDVGPELEPDGLAPIKDYIGRRPAIKTFAEAGPALEQAFATEFPGVGAAEWEVWARRWYRQDNTGLDILYDPKLRDAILAAEDAPLPDLWPFFHALKDVPLAVLRGANSPLISAQGLQNMRDARDDLIWAEVPKRGHVPFLDEAESVDVFQRLIAQVTI